MINPDGDGAGPVTQPVAPELLPPPEPTQPASSEVGADTALSAVSGRHHERAHEGPVHLENARQLGEHRARKTELNLRRVFGYGLLGIVVLKIVAADVVFLIYAAKSDWHIDGTTMQVWLGATVVEVIGLAGVVVKYLFSPDAAPR